MNTQIQNFHPQVHHCLWIQDSRLRLLRQGLTGPECMDTCICQTKSLFPSCRCATLLRATMCVMMISMYSGYLHRHYCIKCRVHFVTDGSSAQLHVLDAGLTCSWTCLYLMSSHTKGCTRFSSISTAAGTKLSLTPTCLAFWDTRRSCSHAVEPRV